jgi:hypothetical protein
MGDLDAFVLWTSSTFSVVRLAVFVLAFRRDCKR